MTENKTVSVEQLVREGRSIEGQMLGYLYVMSLKVDLPYDQREDAGQELEVRIKRYYPDICLRWARSLTGKDLWDELLRSCFSVKTWPISDRSMLKRLEVPTQRQIKGQPVHGKREDSLDSLADRRHESYGPWNDSDEPEVAFEGDTDAEDVAGALVDQIKMDAEEERAASVRQTFPEAECIKAASLRSAVCVLARLLDLQGISKRRIADLLVAMGALKPGQRGTEDRQASRLIDDGEARLVGNRASKRRSPVYVHHPIIELLLSADGFLDLLREDQEAALILLAALAPDLRAQKARMGLVDFTPTVVNAFSTLDQASWPPVLAQLTAEERAIITDYADKKLERRDAELALGQRRIETGHPLLRPIWRMFVASSLTRNVMTGHADVAAVKAQLAELDAAMDADLEAVFEGHRDIARTMVDYARAYLALDRVDLSVLEANLSSAKSAMERARRDAKDHPRFAHDIALRDLVIEARSHPETPPIELPQLLDACIERFVAACDSAELGADNIRQYTVGFSPDVARVLAHAARSKGSSDS